MININKDWKFEPSPPPPTTGYTTTFNCLTGKYPVRESILSWSWLSKIVVVDGGSSDGTRELLEELSQELGDKLNIIDVPMDFSNPGVDGYQKSMAYAMVDTPLAIQFDIDEVCRGSIDKWKEVLKELPQNVDILNLPVLEPLGNINHIRTNKEHTPWKWRVLRVKPEITHGIPKHDQLEVDGVRYSRGGSDGCFFVHCVSEEMYPSKMHKSAVQITKLKSAGDNVAYEEYLQSLIDNNEPFVLHLGHVNLRNKIKHYLTSWHSWWNLLYNKDASDPKNNLYFPGIPVENVTDQMIETKVIELLCTPTVVVDFNANSK